MRRTLKRKEVPHEDSTFPQPDVQRVDAAGSNLGGREHDWTLDVNWHLDQHLKLQANYVRAFSDHNSLVVILRIFELRAQIAF